jgi:hypothetical protein
MQHGGTLGRRSGGTITRQHMKDRLPHSAAMGQGLAITLERTQGIGTTIKSFSGSFVYGCHPYDKFSFVLSFGLTLKINTKSSNSMFRNSRSVG